MVRMGLVIVALALAGLVVLGVGMGLGFLQIDSHGVALVHKDDSADKDSSAPSRVVSADDLLKQKGLTYEEPAALPAPAEAPEPAAAVVAVAPTPAVVPVTPPTPAPVKPAVVAQKPVENKVTPPAPVQPIEASLREPGRREAAGVIRIAAGSDKPITDAEGHVWEPASGFTDANKTAIRGAIPIENTRIPEIYRIERYDLKSWSRKIPNGVYSVRLLMADTYGGVKEPGERVFGVEVQGRRMDDIDIIKETGGIRRALVRTARAEVTDGKLTINFIATGKHLPIINGIEIIADGGAMAARGAERPRERGDDRSVIRVAAGSDKPLAGPNGDQWEASSGFEGGKAKGAELPMDSMRFPSLYQSQQWDPKVWTRKLPNGQYTVLLHFAESSNTIKIAGVRVFSVDVQDQHLGDIDVVKEAGGAPRELVRTATVAVTDGTLTIRFTKQGEHFPFINGIEVIPTRRGGERAAQRDEPNRPAAVAFRVDAGSTTAVRDPRGNTWEAESGFEGGKIVDRGPIAIANTDFPDIYRTEHYDMTTWRKWVPNGRYTVNLHFAETWDGITDSHARVFHVVVQGHELRDLNVAKEAGGLRRAIVKTFHVTVEDGRLSILFHQTGDNVPEINGIEVIPER